MKYLKVWTDFEKVLSPLTDDEIGRLFIAMLRYAGAGEEPKNFIGNESFLWAVAKRDIDTMAEKSEILRQNGLKGGRPKTKENQTEPNETNENQTEPDESLKEKKRKEIKGKENKTNKFTPPTAEEVADYCRERGNNIDAEYFVAYYAARNWELSNGRKMKDWRMSVITWEKNNFSKPNTKTVHAQNFTQRDYSNEQQEAMNRMIEQMNTA